MYCRIYSSKTVTSRSTSRRNFVLFSQKPRQSPADYIIQLKIDKPLTNISDVLLTNISEMILTNISDMLQTNISDMLTTGMLLKIF